MDSIQLRESHKIEKKMGINYYCSHTDGIQGRLRKFPKDFKVEEILPNGRIISINDEDFSFGESEPGLFTEFVLLKKNVESHKAQLKIAQTLNKKIDDIQVAGTKDKTAITAQRATIWRVPPEKLLEIQIKGIKIRAPRTTIYQTYLGNLRGNHFIITIRELPFDKEEIANRLEAINTEIDNFGGIGNFFGHQRFGSRRPISHEVGKFILMGDIEKAVNYYLSEISEDEHELTKKARQLYVETNDPKITLAAFSNEMLFERLILNHLIKRPRDFLGAFQILPKNLQRLFIHSYQSYIWNCAISKRMEMYGNLLPQDIDIIENGEMILPIIGNITEKYDNYLFDYMNELLEKDGLSKANFELKNVKGLKFPGRTRNIVIKPENLKVSMKEINDGEDIVLLEFSLNSGSYATIVLREFMKTSPINY